MCKYNVMSRPLYTTPALEYLDSIVQPSWKVFEYGGGNSTNYYAARCAEVHTVEHNNSWYNTIVSNNPDATVYHIDADQPVLDSATELNTAFDAMRFSLPIRDLYEHSYNEYHGLINDRHQGYASMLCKYPKEYFDVIVVDGMARSRCLWYAAHMINATGIIILDNSDRWHFNDLQAYLVDNGFNRKDFWQPDHPCWCTSFFSKTYDATDGDVARPVNTGDIYHFG